MARGHALHTDGQRDRYDGGQALRNRGYRNSNHRLEHIHERLVKKQTAIGESQHANDQNDNGKDLAELLDLTKERRFIALTFESIELICPRAVSAPVPTTIPRARPDTTKVPE